MKLEDFTEVSGEDWMKLSDPEFVGQTRPAEEGIYWMCWKHDGKLYRTKNSI